MKTLLLILGFIGIFSQKSFSQDYRQVVDLADEYRKLGKSPYLVVDYKDIQGSPYLNDEFSDGEITTGDDKIMVGKLRYNIYTDEIEFIYNDKHYRLSNPENFKEFKVGEQKISYTSYYNIKKITKGFLLVLSEGTYSLLVKKRIIYIKSEKPQPYSTPKPDRFDVKADLIFISYQNKPAVKITSLKNLIKQFPDIEPAVKKYSESKINFDNKNELKKLFDFINAQVLVNKETSVSK